MRDIWIRIIQTGGAKIYGVLLGALSLSITARVLGPEARGELVVIVTWATTFATFAYLSLGQVALHRAARSGGTAWLSESYSTLLVFALTMTLLAWAVAGGLYVSPLKSLYGDVTAKWLLLGLILVPFKIWEHYGGSLLQAVERLDIYNRYQVLGNTIGLLGTALLLLAFNAGVGAVLVSNLICHSIIVFGGLTVLHRLAGGWSIPGLDTVHGYFRDGFKLHANAVGMYFVAGSDVLMLNYFRGSEETAYYQIGVQLMGAMLLFAQAAQMVVNGRVSALGPDRAWPEHRKIILQTTFLIIIVACIASLTANAWMPIIVGNAFGPSIEVFRWLTLAAVGMSFSIIMAPQWIGRGLFGTISLLTLGIGAVNLLLNWVLIPQYGMHGAVASTLVVYTISIIVNGGMALYWNARVSLQ